MKLLYGSQNFGYDTPQSDKDWLEFVYPTWKDIVSNNMVNKEKKNEDGSITKVKDIRLIIKMIEKANFNDLQILYSQEAYECEDLRWFYDNRNLLVRANLRQLFYTNKGYIMSCLKSGTRKDLIRAWCFMILIARAFDIKYFKLKVDGLCDYRLDEEKTIDVETILSELARYEKVVDEFEKDEVLLEKVRIEVERLIKANLYNQ